MQQCLRLGFGYGIQGHALNQDDKPRVLTAVRRGLGFTWFKQQVRWEDMEPLRGQRQWLELDELLDAADTQGVHVLFSVVAAPSWARESEADLTVSGPPADNEDFADYLGALASRYCGQLEAIEVWDEQNLHYNWGNLALSAESYVQMLAAASAAIREACPLMLVISGAPTPAGDVAHLVVDDFTYLQQMLEAGMANHVDGIGAHPSGYNVPPHATLQDYCSVIQGTGMANFDAGCNSGNPHRSFSFRSTMEGYRAAVAAVNPAIPIWPTEFGWAVASPPGYQHYGFALDNSYQEQADWTVQAYMMMKDWGWVGPAFLWNLNFAVLAPGTERALWGIVTADWSPLPVYTALRQMAK